MHYDSGAQKHRVIVMFDFMNCEAEWKSFKAKFFVCSRDWRAGAVWLQYARAESFFPSLALSTDATNTVMIWFSLFRVLTAVEAGKNIRRGARKKVRVISILHDPINNLAAPTDFRLSTILHKLAFLLISVSPFSLCRLFESKEAPHVDGVSCVPEEGTSRFLRPACVVEC